MEFVGMGRTQFAVDGPNYCINCGGKLIVKQSERFNIYTGKPLEIRQCELWRSTSPPCRHKRYREIVEEVSTLGWEEIK